MRTFFYPLMLILALICLQPIASAQTTQPNQDTTRVETRTYSVADLVRANADYPISSDTSGRSNNRGGNLIPQSEPKPQSRHSGVNIDSLIKLIEETIHSESWRDNGGPIGSIRALGTTLIVTNSAAVHESVTGLFRQLRQDPALSNIISVRAFWVSLDVQEVAGIFANRKQNAAGISDMPEVPDALLDKLHIYWTGQTMCFNGQTVSIQAQRDRSYISDLTPIVASNAVAFDPTISVAGGGVQMQITPELIPSGAGAAAAVLDLQSIVVETSIVDPTPMAVATTHPSTVANGPNSIDRITQLTQQFSTTIRIPLRKKILVGGMSMEPVAKDAPSRQLYIVVEVDAVH